MIPIFVEPKFVDKYLSHPCLEVVVLEEEYRLCEQAASGDNFWGNSKKGAYGAGLAKTVDDPFKPARTGLLGQMAFAKVFRLPMDLKYRQGGDDFDNTIGGCKIDIKCATKNSGESLVYKTNEYGREVPINKDIYVLSYLQEEDRQKQYAKIIIVGFNFRKDVLKSEVKPGYKGKGHMNYVLPFLDARPIDHLLEKVLIFSQKRQVFS